MTKKEFIYVVIFVVFSNIMSGLLAIKLYSGV